MSQRVSGYMRQEREAYETPAWVTQALLPHLRRERCTILEPACGSNKIVDVLTAEHNAVGTDMVGGVDFMRWSTVDFERQKFNGVVTNPPYGAQGKTAAMFIAHALLLTRPRAGFVAMLLRADFDHAVTRVGLFGRCQPFMLKLQLLKRIVWFERDDGKAAQPSVNHAWFLWDWRHTGAPMLAYGPTRK